MLSPPDPDAAMTIPMLAVAVTEALSVTWMVSRKEPLAAGVPVIEPVEDSVSPAGSVPNVTDHA